MRAELLPDLVEGRRTAAFAVTDRAGAFDPAAVIGHRDGSGGADARSRGAVERVVDGGAADDLLVAATGPDGVALYAVDASAARRRAEPAGDPRPDAAAGHHPVHRRPGAIWWPDPRKPSASSPMRLQVGSALLAVEQVGAAQHLLDLAVEYAKSRLQFGRPIGSFQAVKHKLADMLVDLEHARSSAYHAVWALTDGSDDPALATSIAQATASAALQPDRAATPSRCSAASGSPGNTRRTCTSSAPATDAALLGTAEQHRSRVAELVLDNAVADRAPWVATGAPA